MTIIPCPYRQSCCINWLPKPGDSRQTSHAVSYVDHYLAKMLTVLETPEGIGNMREFKR
jgi:hypothetical protein